MANKPASGPDFTRIIFTISEFLGVMHTWCCVWGIHTCREAHGSLELTVKLVKLQNGISKARGSWCMRFLCCVGNFLDIGITTFNSTGIYLEISVSGDHCPCMYLIHLISSSVKCWTNCCGFYTNMMHIRWGSAPIPPFLAWSFYHASTSAIIGSSYNLLKDAILKPLEHTLCALSTVNIQTVPVAIFNLWRTCARQGYGSCHSVIHSFCHLFYLVQCSLLLPNQGMNRISTSMACILTHGFCLNILKLWCDLPGSPWWLFWRQSYSHLTAFQLEGLIRTK